jgi:hypothetical protein
MANTLVSFQFRKLFLISLMTFVGITSRFCYAVEMIRGGRLRIKKDDPS